MTLRILNLEDNENDTALIRAAMEPVWPGVEVARVDTREAFDAAVAKGGFDVILADYTLPEYDGVSALAMAREKAPDVPVIFVTGTMGEEEAIETLKMGATDFVLKGRLGRLVPVVKRALAEARERRERRLAEEALRESEERFRAVAESANDAIICLRPPGVVTFWNRKAEEIFGYSSGEVAGKYMHDIIVPEREREKSRVGLVRFFDTGKGPMVGTRVDTMALRRDGVEFPIELSISAMRVGDEWQTTGIVRDISERKKAEEAVRKSEEKYRTLLENLPQRIFYKDSNSAYVTCNMNYARDLNIRPNEITGRTDHDFFPKELADKYRADDKRVMGRGETEEMVEQYPVGGKTIWVRAVKTPTRDGDGKVNGVLCIFWDITEQKKAEDQIREQVATLERFMKVTIQREFRIKELIEENARLKEAPKK